MIKKLFSIVLVLTLTFSIFIPINVCADNNDTLRYGDVLDIGTKLRYLEKDVEYRQQLDAQIKDKASKINFNEEPVSERGGENNFAFDGGTKYWLGYDVFYGYGFKTYTLRSIGKNVEIWVADDLSFEDDRPDPVITQEQVDRLRDEFDSVIYSTDTDFFGIPDSHTGVYSLLEAWGYVEEGYYTPEDGIERIIILVDNVRDESYYDQSYPFYITGFYSSAYEGYFDRNIISIDTNNWEERLEATYFGTTAHELEHLIHDDNDTYEDAWIDEGMADFAEYLCGYGHSMEHVNFFLDHPENSLVEWDDHYFAETGPETLADYGQAYLLQLYLNDHYGKEFIRTLAKNQKQGIESVNEVLSELNIGIDFEELFRRFTIAVAIDNPEPEEGIYNFESIDININYESALEYDKDGVPAWGGDYKELDKAQKIQSIKIDGIEYLLNFWKVVDDPLGNDEMVLWGNSGNEIENQLILKADLTDVDSATLKFDNYIDIEEQWDFGIVQVSTDNGQSWISLSNENTRSDIVSDGYPKIFENLPGFTGHYDNWVSEEFDLTPYIGQEILINFNYMTDWGYNDLGWFIDNIEIPEIGYYNDCSNKDGFFSIDEITETRVDYALAFINQKSLGQGNNKQNYRVLNIDPFNITEADTIQLKEFFSGGKNYVIIWYAAPEGNKGTVDYIYEITNKSEYNKNKKSK